MASATENRYVNLYINGKQAGKTLNEIRANQRRLTAEINGGKLSQEQYNQKVAELRKYNSVLQQHRDKVSGINRQWSQMKAVAVGVIGGNILLAAFQKLASFIPNMIKMNAQLSESFADVRRTTGLTADGMERMNERLRNFNTKSPRSELLALTRDAGKLGIEGIANLEGFVAAANQINVSLGQDLGADAVKTLGKLNNVFKVSEIYGYEQGLLKLGSVLNELGMASEAEEGKIVDFTSRLAGVAAQAKITYPEIAAMGAVLDSLGQRIETSGTATTQAIVGMFRDTETYARIAGKSVGEFSELLNKDANEAFLVFLEGLNGNNDGLSELTTRFDQLGIDGSRAITVLAALAGSTDKLREQQTLANKAFEEGTSITAEYNLKNENAAANLAKITRYLNQLWINSDILRGLEKVLKLTADFVAIPVSKVLEDQRRSMNALVSQITAGNTPQERRLELMQRLIDEYPVFRDQIDKETTSNEKLLEILKKVNNQYINSIILQRKKEEVMKAAEGVADMEEKRQRKIEQGLQMAARLEQEYGFELDRTKDVVQQIGQAYAKMNNLAAESFSFAKVKATEDLRILLGAIRGYGGAAKKAQAILDNLEEEKMRLAERLGLNVLPENIGGAAGNVTPEEDEVLTPAPRRISDEQQKKLDEAKKEYDKLIELIKSEDERLQIARMEGYDRERLQLELHFENLREQAKGHHNELLEIDSLYNEARLQLDEKYQMEREEAIREIDLATMDPLDAEMAKLEAHYDALIKLAQKFALDIEHIEKAKNDAMAALRAQNSANAMEESQKAAAAQASLAFEGAGYVIDSFRMIGDAQAKNAEFQADMMMFMQLANAGMALSNAAASAKGVTPVDYLAGLAAVIAAITTRIAAAKRIAEEAGPPPKRPAYALGTMSSRHGWAQVNEAGRELQYLPGGTTVLPADLSQQIMAANAFSRPGPSPNFSSINEGLTFGQATQTVQSSASAKSSNTSSTGAIEHKLDELIQVSAQATHKKVIFTQQDFTRFSDRYEKNRARVSFTK